MSEQFYGNEQKYEKAPLVEAVCQFYFDKKASLLPLDKIISLRQKFSENFPKLEEKLISEVKSAEAKANTPVDSMINFREERRVRRVFSNFNIDKTKLIQFGDHLFSVNFFAPYISWKEFKPVILDAFNNFSDVLVGSKLSGIRLTYINHFEFSSEMPIDLAKYFNYFPNFPPELDGIGRFEINSIAPQKKGQLEISFKDISNNKSDETIVLALVINHLQINLNIENIENDLDYSHSVVGRAFEYIISNETRELLGVKSNE